MNAMASRSHIHISEVGPRDGLQSVKATMPTADKCRWISALAAAGLREIEVGSFVPAQLLPQMADVADVVRHALTLPGLTVMALVPNRRGAQAALAAGVHNTASSGVAGRSATEAKAFTPSRKPLERGEWRAPCSRPPSANKRRVLAFA